MKKNSVKKLSHNDKAANRVIEAVKAGQVLKASDVLRRDELTVGAFSEAVDRGARFAIIGWRTGQTTTFRTLEEAAWTFVAKVGSTRARDAAITGMKRAA